MFSSSDTAEPTYTSPEELETIADRVVGRIQNATYAPDEDDIPKPGSSGICKIVRIPAANSLRGYYGLNEEKNKTLATDVRQAPAFFFGGLTHDTFSNLGGVLAPFRRQSLIPLDRMDAFHKSLVFCPSDTREGRIKAAYRWNYNKLMPGTNKANEKKEDVAETVKALESFAEQLWENRFLDEKTKKLLPSTQFNGFSFVTYSIGGRLAYMVENILREKLRTAINANAGVSDIKLSPEEENDAIQSYFSKCRTLSIGHGLDWQNIPENTPAIPKLFLIGQEDKGVVYHKDFYEFMKKQEFGDPNDLGIKSGILYDISAHFHSPAGSHQVLILKDGILRDVADIRSTPNLHGLPDYARALDKYRSTADVQYFIDALNAAIQPAQSKSSFVSGPQPPIQQDGPDKRAAGRGGE